MRIDSLEDQICTWKAPGSGAVFKMQASLVNQLKAKVTAGLLALPRRGMEVGGVLLGRILNSDPLEVQITAFESVECEHRFGPTFVLSDHDLAGLDPLLAGLTAREDAAIVGYFRSCTGREQALDDADLELLRTRFPAPESIVLSIKPLSLRECEAWFFHRQDGTLPTVPGQRAMPFDDTQTAEAPKPRLVETPAPPAVAPVAETPPPEPEAVELPAPVPLVPLAQTPSAQPAPEAAESPALHHRPTWHWVALALMLLVATIAGYDYGSSTRQPEPPPPAPKVIAPKTEAPPVVILPPTPPKPAQPLPPVVPAALIQQAEPELPPGIRARVEIPIVVHIDVSIDASGKVTKAAVRGEGDGLFRFLGERAVIAAQSSTFKPGRDVNGKPVPSTALLPFVFDPLPQ